MSRLRVQNQKSVLIGLNTSGTPWKWNGFPVLDLETTTRQLGYWVVNRDTIKDNWDIRIGKIQRRLKVATTMSNSDNTVQRVVLPSILYTGNIFTPKEVLAKLKNLHNQFDEDNKYKT
ncbi:RxLR effector protein [Phytophthora megakarya]|uniref:RxLR effector protein n=1 Tax=Phytophthora megakarya TaxID=4795 RepID=A0A225VWI9_9STRA|nr:RxLR effector protein [Phytophthora megakarya]